jgi:nucleoside-diphosphate-sugar epimerase
MRVFLAGATGAIGRRLIPLLHERGLSIIGTTRSPAKAEALAAAGVTPVVVDMLDAAAVFRAVAEARPDVVMHQLTDLPRVFAPEALEAGRLRTARLREEATPYLIGAALAAGVRRVIVQSICFVYAPGPRPHLETDPLASPSIQAMESGVLSTAGIEAVILRYGRFWGPDTWSDMPAGDAPLHVDAAAGAAVLAVGRGAAGVYNIAEDDGTVSIAKARRELGFDPGFRLPV